MAAPVYEGFFTQGPWAKPSGSEAFSRWCVDRFADKGYKAFIGIYPRYTVPTAPSKAERDEYGAFLNFYLRTLNVYEYIGKVKGVYVIATKDVCTRDQLSIGAMHIAYRVNDQYRTFPSFKQAPCLHSHLVVVSKKKPAGKRERDSDEEQPARRRKPSDT